MIPACPSLMCFFFFFLNRGNTEGANSSKVLCLMFVRVFCFDVCLRVLLCINLCHDLFCRFERIYGLMTCEQSEWEAD